MLTAYQADFLREAAPAGCFRPDTERRELCAEVVWSAVHGLAVLAAGGRIPPALQEERVDFLVGRLGDTPSDNSATS